MSIGHELLVNPSVLLLDEPTSGALPPAHSGMLTAASHVASSPASWRFQLGHPREGSPALVHSAGIPQRPTCSGQPCQLALPAGARAQGAPLLCAGTDFTTAMHVVVYPAIWRFQLGHAHKGFRSCAQG